jgi:maltose alpha-D-glucosyltransferase/alpha-amylase
VLEPWARFWRRWVSSAFLRSYLQRCEGAAFVPTDRRELATFLSILLLEKSLYELAYELDSRPDWVEIPMRGILRLIDELAV